MLYLNIYIQSLIKSVAIVSDSCLSNCYLYTFRVNIVKQVLKEDSHTFFIFFRFVDKKGGKFTMEKKCYEMKCIS